MTVFMLNTNPFPVKMHILNSFVSSFSKYSCSFERSFIFLTVPYCRITDHVWQITDVVEEEEDVEQSAVVESG